MLKAERQRVQVNLYNVKKYNKNGNKILRQIMPQKCIFFTFFRNHDVLIMVKEHV
jgi:hypothetical protein